MGIHDCDRVRSFLLLLLSIGFSYLIINRKTVPNYTLKEAQEKVQEGKISYRSTLLAIVAIDAVSWFWLGRSGPLDIYLIALGFVDSLFLLRFLTEYQKVVLTKKRIAALTNAHEGDRPFQTKESQAQRPRLQPFSPEVWQVAETYDLGEPTALYKTAFRMSIFMLGGGAVLIMLADLSSSSLLMTKVIVGLLVGVMLFLVWFPQFRARHQRIYLYTKGLASLGDHTITVVRWEDIAQVRYRGRLTRLGNPFCQVLMKDGRTITFAPQILGVEKVGKEIEAHIE